VRAARARLKKLAEQHPSLTGPKGKENRAGWRALLEEQELMPTKMVSFRLPEELLARIDALVASRSAAAGIPGSVGRVDVVKFLLELGLSSLEGTKKARKK
jgi:hypothetical protein